MEDSEAPIIIPGLTHYLHISDFISARSYNMLPSLSLQPQIPSSILHRLGKILVSYNLEHILGVHLIYNRFSPGGIAEGSFVAATEVDLTSSAGVDNRGGSHGSTVVRGEGGVTKKKVVWQAGLWELGNIPTEDLVGFVRGRLYRLARIQGNGQSLRGGQLGIPPNNTPNLDITAQIAPPTMPPQPNIILGQTHAFQAYEYEYGPPHPHLCHSYPHHIHIPNAFWRTLANFLIANRLENCLGFEVLDYNPQAIQLLGGMRYQHYVEEFDPGKSRKAAVVEARTGRQLSWGFSRARGTMSGEGEELEVDVEVGLVKLSE